MRDSSPALRRIVFALLGIALLAGGGYGTLVGINSLGGCGSTTLQANELSEPAGGIVHIENLTEAQQQPVRESIDGEDPAVTGEEWPWSESAVVVQYQRTYYELYTVTTPCPFPPGLILLFASLTMILGVAALIPVGRWLVRLRRAE